MALVFQLIKICRTIFKKGHPRNISMKLFQNMTSRSRGEHCFRSIEKQDLHFYYWYLQFIAYKGFQYSLVYNFNTWVCNILSHVLQIFLYLEAFECNTTFLWIHKYHFVLQPIRSQGIFIL